MILLLILSWLLATQGDRWKDSWRAAGGSLERVNSHLFLSASSGVRMNIDERDADTYRSFDVHNINFEYFTIRGQGKLDIYDRSSLPEDLDITVVV